MYRHSHPLLVRNFFRFSATTRRFSYNRSFGGSRHDINTLGRNRLPATPLTHVQIACHTMHVAAALPPPVAVVMHNGVLVEGAQTVSAKELLSSGPHGAYTTARTVGGNNVFELDLHLRRLSESCAIIFSPENNDDNQDDDVATSTSAAAAATVCRAQQLSSTIDSIPARVLDAMRSSFTAFDTQFPMYAQDERRITLLLSVVQDQKSLVPKLRLDIHTHVCLLPPVPLSPVKIHIIGNPRGNARAKDSLWVTQRQSIERNKPADVNELVLGDHQGHLYEGTQTNFFVVRNGKVITAKDHILEGTVRALVLQLCKEEGIPVELEPPLLSGMDEWDEAWIASTSRLLLPVDFIGHPDHDDCTRMLKERWMPKDRPVGSRVLALVKSHLQSASLPIFDP